MEREPVRIIVSRSIPIPLPARGRHAVGERADVILVHLVRLLVTAGAHAKLHLEAAALFLRVVQLGIGVA